MNLRLIRKNKKKKKEKKVLSGNPAVNFTIYYDAAVYLTKFNNAYYLPALVS